MEKNRLVGVVLLFGKFSSPENGQSSPCASSLVQTRCSNAIQVSLAYRSISNHHGVVSEKSCSIQRVSNQPSCCVTKNIFSHLAKYNKHTHTHAKKENCISYPVDSSPLHRMLACILFTTFGVGSLRLVTVDLLEPAHMLVIRLQPTNN